MQQCCNLQQLCETMVRFFSRLIRFKMVLASLWWSFKEGSTLWLLTSISFTSIKKPPFFHTWNDDKGMLNVVGNS
jgi:hypothetical protein